MSESFVFLDPGALIDGDLTLVLERTTQAFPERDWVPAYHFAMRNSMTHETMGRITLRVGHTPDVEQFAGHIGYSVEKAYRGHHYAARSCCLLFALARSHGLDPLWITCNPDNWPSRRTCELAGGVMVEIVETPPNSEYRQKGEAQKCRYRFCLKGLLD